MGKRDPICADFSELAVDTSISSGVKGVPKKKYMRDISHSGAGTARGDGGKRNLRRPNKCQKRPTIGAKETYHVRTFESLVGLELRDTLPCRAVNTLQHRALFVS